MSSSHEPVYWDSLGHTLLAATGYNVSLPIGTTDWAVINISGGTLYAAGSGATLATGATSSVPIPTATSFEGKGQSLFVGNLTGAGLAVVVAWRRPGRQPDMNAGTATFTAL